jgi:outer membrane protein assembly factor BamB
MPGPSAATPSVSGDRVFVPSFDEQTHELLALGLDRATGKILWSHAVGFGVESRNVGRENNLAESSPVSDGDRVVFLYGSGDLVAFDYNGKLLWQSNLQEDYGAFRMNFGYASSPLLFQGRLFVQVTHRSDSYVLAIDPGTGKTLWEIDRPTDARAESQEAYTTPHPRDLGDGYEVLVLAGDMLTAYNPATGRENWRWAAFNPRKRENFRIISSPVSAEGMVFVTAPQMNPLYALSIVEGKPEVRWTFGGATSDVATPAYHTGKLYALAGRRSTITCLRADTGGVVWQGRLDGASYLRASPTVADGKVFLIGAEGRVFVLSAGEKFEIISQFDMGEYPCRSTIVAAGDRLYLRTGVNLYCIGRGSALQRDVALGP